MAKPLVLNFLPIALSATSFSGGTFIYEGPEKLRELREKYRDTYVLHRRGNQVYCIPLEPNCPLLGDPTTFEVRRNSSLIRRLIHEALIRFFLGRDQQLRSVKPIRLANKQINLLEKCGVDGTSPLANAIKINPEYQFDARVIYLQHRPPIFGVVVNVSTVNRISATAYELIQRGVNLTDRYVFQHKAPDSPIWDPDFFSDPLGRVSEIDDERLLLTDYLKQPEVNSRDCFLEPRRENVDWCLQSLAPIEYEAISFELQKQIFEYTGAEERKRVMDQLRDRLKELQPIPVANGLTMTVGDFSMLKPGVGSGKYRTLSRPDVTLVEKEHKVDDYATCYIP